MEEKLLKTYKLIALQLILGIICLVSVRLISFLISDSMIIRRVAEISFPVAIFLVNTVTSYVIHSMRDKDANFKMISVMCFFAGVFELIRALTSAFGMITVPGCIAMAFTAVYVIGFATLMIKQFMTGEALMLKKWIRFRKAFTITTSVLVISVILTKIPKIDMFAFIFFVLAIVVMYILAIRFTLLVKRSAGAVK
ncbi:MAG: hypothetical protein K6F49_03180 [Saccharofermentans sp.]|nr:hypothetical protein [Saccharofermentans sp.]